MKLVLLFALFLLSALALALAGCATQQTSPDVAAIQASCDSDDPQTTINGHAYFCTDFAHFQAQMQAIGRALQSRGI